MSMNKQKGFTLIELSIVLVIIGLVVGGVLVGQDLIRAAGLRGQITQIVKFNTAILTFRGKYNALPGDMFFTEAAAFGFRARAGSDGQGDGDAIIEPCAPGDIVPGCEFILFWADLSSANLIAGQFAAVVGDDEPITTTSFGESLLYFPESKLVGGATIMLTTFDTKPYYEIARTTSINPAYSRDMVVTTRDAYAIDVKLDNGVPYTGTIVAASFDLVDFSVFTFIAPNPNLCVDAGGVYNLDRPELKCPFSMKIRNW